MFDAGTIIQASTSTSSHMMDLDRRQKGNVTNAAKRIRESFMDYFVNEGQVPRQSNFVKQFFLYSTI